MHTSGYDGSHNGAIVGGIGVGGTAVGGTRVGGTAVGGIAVGGMAVGGIGVSVGGTGVSVGGTGVGVGSGTVINGRYLGFRSGVGVDDGLSVGVAVDVGVGTSVGVDVAVGVGEVNDVVGSGVTGSGITVSVAVGVIVGSVVGSMPGVGSSWTCPIADTMNCADTDAPMSRKAARTQAIGMSLRIAPPSLWGWKGHASRGVK